MTAATRDCVVTIDLDPVWVAVPNGALGEWADRLSAELAAQQGLSDADTAAIAAGLTALEGLDRSSNPTWRLLFLPDATVGGIVVDIDLVAEVDGEIEPAPPSVDGSVAAEPVSVGDFSGLRSFLLYPQDETADGAIPVRGELSYTLIDPRRRLLLRIYATSYHLGLLVETARYCEELVPTIHVTDEGGTDPSG